jgi:hypothetical protein
VSKVIGLQLYCSTIKLLEYWGVAVCRVLDWM